MIKLIRNKNESRNFSAASIFRFVVSTAIILFSASCMLQHPATAQDDDDTDSSGKPTKLEGKSIADLNKIIERNPDNWEAFWDRARYHRMRDERNSAINDYTKALSLSPKHGQSLLGLSQMYVMIAQYDKALVDADEFVKLYPRSHAAYRQRARVKMAMEAYRDSIADLETALKLCPNDVIALQSLTLAYDNLGEHLKGVETGTQYIFASEQSDRKKLYFAEQERALVWIHAHEYENAYDDLQRGLLVNPKHSQLWAYLAYALAMDNQLPKAIEAMKMCQRLETFAPRGHRLNAEMYRAAGKWTEAIQSYSTSTSMEPDYGPGFMQRAIAEIALGQYTSALEDLKRALERIPQSSQCYSYLALVEDQLEKTDESEKHMQKAFELTPDLPINFVNRARVAMHHGKFEDAAKDCNEALKRNPLLGDAFAAASTAYAKCGMDAEAKTFLDKAHTLGWRDPEKELNAPAAPSGVSIKITDPPKPDFKLAIENGLKAVGEGAPTQW